MSIFADIGRELLTQDNACTADPMFMVQRFRRKYGIDTAYVDTIAWLHADEGNEVDAEEAAALEKAYHQTYKEPDGFTRTAYVDEWESVQAFFTRSAAQRYADRNAHNLRSCGNEPRIYVESGYRNPEWIALRTAFIEAAKWSVN